jgi:anti-anti-sigma factor
MRTGEQMDNRTASDAPVRVALPAEIDVANVAMVYSLLSAAGVLGAPLIIADLTGTSFCDVAGVNCLLAAHHEAAAGGAQLRLALSPWSTVRRVMVMLGAHYRLPVYFSVEEASDPRAVPREPLSVRRLFACPPLPGRGPDGAR